MTKLHVVLLSLIFCSAAVAEQAVLICEVPAEEGEVACGPNNTYETYRFAFDTDEFDKKGGADYGYQKVKGCDISGARIFRYHYTVTEEAVTFQTTNGPYRTVVVDRESLIAHKGLQSYEKRDYTEDFPCRLEEGSSEAWSKGRRRSNSWQ